MIFDISGRVSTVTLQFNELFVSLYSVITRGRI